MHQERRRRIHFVEEGMLEYSFFINGRRMVTLSTDFAFRKSDNFYRSVTYDVPIVKDMEIGWHVECEEIIRVLKERYPFTCSRKDLYIDFNTIKLIDNGKTHS